MEDSIKSELEAFADRAGYHPSQYETDEQLEEMLKALISSRVGHIGVPWHSVYSHVAPDNCGRLVAKTSHIDFTKEPSLPTSFYLQLASLVGPDTKPSGALRSFVDNVAPGPHLRIKKPADVHKASILGLAIASNADWKGLAEQLWADSPKDLHYVCSQVQKHNSTLLHPQDSPHFVAKDVGQYISSLAVPYQSLHVVVVGGKRRMHSRQASSASFQSVPASPLVEEDAQGWTQEQIEHPMIVQWKSSNLLGKAFPHDKVYKQIILATLAPNAPPPRSILDKYQSKLRPHVLATEEDKQNWAQICGHFINNMPKSQVEAFLKAPELKKPTRLSKSSRAHLQERFIVLANEPAQDGISTEFVNALTI